MQKILKRKIRKGIVQASFDLEWLSFEAKVNFACNRLLSTHFTQVKIFVSFWEKTEILQRLLTVHNCSNWEIIRDYKVGRYTPGQLEICFEESMDVKFVHSLIKKHYGYELGKPDGLNLDVVFAFENGNDKTICHLYDDRGFHVFYVNS